MLELKDITKIYKSKKGEDVKALDGINLVFSGKGMVFVVGKSGSGKSTLLNIIGGLDKYSEGDLVIKGKSTKNFSQKDFDSYRNTMIGFVFQEYNILEEFTVAQNIGLALELQGKKATSESVSRILEQVDLVGFGNRKPNELSGGQRQRVAIARALFKEPEIIMADEPTGALDSATGKQVFETLKKLSKEKLVIVISHDLDFARTYGDRIIEFKDGRIVSDETKTITSDYSIEKIVLEDNQILIEKGYKLTKEDLNIINDYLDKIKSESPIIKINKAKQEKQSKFTQTKQVTNKEEHESYQLIKSKLPFSKSLKMALSSLKHKKIRLFFSIFLAAIAFSFLGMATTASFYNKETVALNSLKNKQKELFLKHTYSSIYQPKIGLGADNILLEEIKNMDSELITKYVYFQGRQHANFYPESPEDRLDTYGQDLYYSSNTSGMVNLTKEEVEKLGWTLVGNMPENSEEVVITDLIYEGFLKKGYYNKDTKVRINSEEDIIGEKLKLYMDMGNQEEYLIVGVIDTHLKDDKYDDIKKLKPNIDDDFFELIKKNNYNNYVQNTPRNLLIVNKNQIEKIKQKGLKLREQGLNNKYNVIVMDPVKYEYYGAGGKKITTLPSDKNSYIKQVSLANLYHQEFKDDPEFLDTVNQIFDDMTLEQMSKELNQKFTDKKTAITEYLRVSFALRTINTNFSKQRELWELVKTNYLESSDIKLEEEEFILRGPYQIEIKRFTLKPVGFMFTEDANSPMALTREFIKENLDAYEADAVIALSDKAISDDVLKGLIKRNFSDDSDKITVENPSLAMVIFFDKIIVTLSEVFLWVGVAFALFASLLMLNFISTSVSYKKQEIGILRAIGASSRDVQGIFIKEATIIALIEVFIAVVFTTAVMVYINTNIYNAVSVNFLDFGVIQIGIMLIISLSVAYLSSAIPVFGIARKKPIDAIKGK
ncbi:ABC-type transport system, ATPase component [Alteracholeplasma palmae J233]|uniref:ABC-type transport system, ATPase component n=1 Tax=Alteracholeplasma palmae (strain ATCC 49389 / J233) TaxID=1318466 RepID=U4KQP5_ALTPJ|nr:ABC transporter ATP-binding protein/permease [Alteracholeplasma palmae]CCV64940.1 ABC-type transport system, ATPase component [Alteracholeplasma palmae J233]